MNTNKKWNLLFIKDTNSKFNINTKKFSEVFNQVDIVNNRSEALKCFNKNEYDIVVSDLSQDPKELAFLKQLRDIKEKQTIFALISPKDTDKLFAVSELGVHAFELSSEQFDMALEEIAKFNPYS